MHWHQPHAWSEMTRGGIGAVLSDPEANTSWWVGGERRTGTAAERDAIAERGWNRFVAGSEAALPNPYRPLDGGEAMARFDRQTILERIDELGLDAEEREVLLAECESLAHGFAHEAGAFAVVRWHVLSGSSLELTQYTGGRVTIQGGTQTLLGAIAGGASFETRLSTPVAAVSQTAAGVEVTTAAGETIPARAVVVAVPLNTLGAIAFEPGLSELKQEAIGYGQASRGIKIFVRARGETTTQNAIQPGHEFGYLATEWRYDDGTQTLIGFGLDAAAIDASDRAPCRRRWTPSCRATRCSTRPRTTGSTTRTRAARGPSTGPAGTRGSTPRCAAPRAGSSWPAPISRTAGPASWTAPSSRA